MSWFPSASSKRRSSPALLGSLRPLLLWPEIVGVMLAIRAIVLLGPKRSSTILDRLARRPRRAVETDDLVARVDVLLQRGRSVLGGTCLVRGMTLYYFLRRMGQPVRLDFGVGDVGGRIEGHCWLVVDGVPILERRDPREVFGAIFSIPAAESST